MKRRWVIGLVVAVILAAGGWVIWRDAPGPPPVLVLKSYEKAVVPVESRELSPWPEPVIGYAVFEFKNVSRRAVWIDLLGISNSVITNVNYLQRYSSDNGNGKMHMNMSVSVWSGGMLFFDGRKLRPGESADFKVGLMERKEDHRVGIVYYTGDFKDVKEFMNYKVALSGIQIIPSAADGFKAKVAYWWKRIVARHNIQKRHEVWYPEALEQERLEAAKK